ncbi:hypothetical protein G3M53_06310, partial [Streptomyces sp. SID7982]|nr:hypothetical protein [Streptomyces sp. SID7982]
SDFARLRPLVETARELRSLGPLRETVTGVLRLDPSASVGEAQIQRVFWARVKAREWMSLLTAPDSVAVRALHLSAPDPARRDDLGMLATRAIAAGHTPYNVDQLAAFHLEELGAFDPRTRLISAPSSGANGRTAGRDWVGRPALGQYLDPAALAVVEQRPDGSYDRTGEEPAPWAGRGTRPPYVVAVADAGPGRAWLDLPGGRFAVPNTEVAELVSRDPDLIGRG